MPTFPWEVAAKAVLYLAVLAAIGTCAIQSLLLPLLGLPAREVIVVSRALAPVRTGAAAVVLIALGLRAVAQTAAVFGWPAVLSWDEVQVVVVASRWGAAWHLQMVAASLFLAASLWAGRGRPGHEVWDRIAATAALILCYSVPLLGHGASSWWQMLLHGTHILGAGAWVGVLMALPLMRVPWALRLTLLRGISPLALSGAAILGLAGAVMTWAYLGPLSNLWATTYGRVLALKLAGVCGVAGCGLVNWRRFAAERRGAAWVEQLGPVAIEVVLAAAVVVVTAVLTEMAHP